MSIIYSFDDIIFIFYYLTFVCFPPLANSVDFPLTVPLHFATEKEEAVAKIVAQTLRDRAQTIVTCHEQ